MKTLQVASLFLALGFVGTSQAVTPPQLPANGAYAINAIYVEYADVGGWINRGCLVHNHKPDAPVLHDWNNGLFSGVGQCGLSSDPGVLLQNRQAVWDIYPVTTRAGAVHYVIKSRVDGTCLIRSNNGYATRPSLYRWWGLGARDDMHCGWPDADALARNGQAAWKLAEFGTQSTDDFFLVMEMTGPTYPVELSIDGNTLLPTFLKTPSTGRWFFKLTKLR